MVGKNNFVPNYDTLPSAVVFILGFIFFWLCPAWLVNISVLMLVRRSVVPSFRSLATSYKTATIWGWCSVLAALSIIFYPQELIVWNENSSEFVIVGFGGYLWIASVVLIAVAYTLVYKVQNAP